MFNYAYKIVHRITGELATYTDTFIENCTGYFGGPWGSSDENGEPNFICIPNEIPLGTLKADKINELKNIASGILSVTDYKALKAFEGALSVEEFEPIKVARQTIRNKCNELQSLAQDAATKEELDLIVWSD